MVNIMHRLAECSHLLLDVLSFAPVKHGGRKKQQHAFFFRFCHVFLIAVSNQIQLGKYRQVVVQQLADDGRVVRGAVQTRAASGASAATASAMLG